VSAKSLDLIIEELRERLKPTFDLLNWSPTRGWRNLDHVNRSDVERWCDASGLTRDDLYDGLACRLAEDFANGSLPFGFCDVVINDLWAV
jgi:hypothetical protein